MDESVLARFRASPRCHLCNRLTPEGCEPHHYIRKGMGGASTIDDDWNLLALCGHHAKGIGCHWYVHAGFYARWIELEAIAMREGREPEVIQAWLDLVKRLPKGSEIPEKP